MKRDFEITYLKNVLCTILHIYIPIMIMVFLARAQAFYFFSFVLALSYLDTSFFSRDQVVVRSIASQAT